MLNVTITILVLLHEATLTTAVQLHFNSLVFILCLLVGLSPVLWAGSFMQQWQSITLLFENPDTFMKCYLLNNYIVLLEYDHLH